MANAENKPHNSLPESNRRLNTHEAFLFERSVVDGNEVYEFPVGTSYAFLLCTEGSAVFEINKEHLSISGGEVYFLRPHDASLLKGKLGKSTKFLVVYFRSDTADFLLERYKSDLDHRFFWAHSKRPAHTYLEGAQLERAVNTFITLENTLRSLLRLEHFLLTMMTFVLDDVSRIDPSAPDWLIKACRSAHSPEVFRKGSRGFIAVAGRTPEHVSRVSKKYLGMTPSKYVNQIRIQHAAMLLRREATSLELIAEAIGVENLSYFHRLFRSQYGCTPASYRRRHKRAGLEKVPSVPSL